MKKLVQTEKCSIIYGEFHGQPDQELFRCPRELDNVDLRRYVNENRCLLGFEADTDTTDLKSSGRYIGYYRLYFRGRWYGRWMEEIQEIDRVACVGVDEIVNWLTNMFPHGCSYDMEDYLAQFPTWGSKNRYLLKPIMSDKYKVMFDTTYGNGDYPVRIYLYQ